MFGGSPNAVLPSMLSYTVQQHLETGRPGQSLPLHLDKAYEAGWLKKALRKQRYIPCIQSRKEEHNAMIKDVDFKTSRWVVERTHSWMNRYRRILIRWEKKIYR
ncbi:transposase [Xenorhabdus szentirmaii]|uniref:Transposase n=1 Tax=Xenorhabdus szentirmaii DSM 16338 TaxID=1427518 RepID=W1IPZ8_9GAMM|nr:transposase [Xenorhabdus sp. 42]PHM32577.1 transposase [Xenorhabdus szentirmaii DSM 16338]PHM41115.1 transposase [Xenorhabdus szentirmaii]CDL80567.1 hypothetical protein XSR1_10047 [Xenorhabdus szentirmaii DSM 16338]